MGTAKYRIAADGFPARDAPMWTEEKLMILEAYIPAFAKATMSATRSGGWYGLDLFAGGGLSYSLSRECEINGSALIMLKAGPPAATRVLLCEQHRRTHAALEARTAPYHGRRAFSQGTRMS